MSEKSKTTFLQRLAEGKGASLRQAREKKGLTQAELGALAGTSQQTVDRIEKGQIRDSKLYPALAEAAGLVIEGFDPDRVQRSLQELQDQADADAKRLYKNGKRRTFIADAEDEDLLTVYSRDAELVLQVADQIPRGYPVTSVADAFAVFVQDSRLAPALIPGDIAVINPHLPAYEGCDALLARTEHGVRKGMMRRLVSIFDDHWLVEGAGTSAVERVSRDEWPDAEPVVTKFYRIR